MHFGFSDMDPGSWDGWLSAVLSFVAILIGIALAAVALAQAAKIAKSQAALETWLANRQDAMEKESYVSGRMQGLVDHAREAIVEARTILDLTDPRTSELLSFPENDPALISERRTNVLSALSRLQTQVELLRVYAITMPAVASRDDAASVAVSRDDTARTALYKLMDEGAWLFSEALHLATLAFEAESLHDDADLSNEQSIIDALLNGSFVNLPRRILSDLNGKDPDHVPYMGQNGSPWDGIYERREKILLDSGVARPSKFTTSLTQYGASALRHTVDRFQDKLIAVLDEWNALKVEKKDSAVQPRRFGK